jgi:TolB-like protein
MIDRISRMVMLLAAVCLLTAIGVSSAAETPGLNAPNNAARAAEIAPHPAPLSMAVLPFDAKDKLIGGQIAEVISSRLSADPEIQLVEREQLDRILEEQKLSLSAAVQPEAAARIGWLAGARVLVVGRAYVIDEQMLITARVVGVETGRVFISQERGSVQEKLLPVLDRLAEQVYKTIQTRQIQLVAPEVPADKDKLFDSLAEQLKGRDLPQIVIAVPETHYGSAAADPAAETELILRFARCGFKVTDPGVQEQGMAAWAKDYYRNSASLPIPRLLPEEVGIILIGQAFSEGGGRFGDIYSAKGRIEVRALDRKTGAVIAIARRTTAAVDLSERMAAKQALENAAASIAYELIPKIAAVKPVR